MYFQRVYDDDDTEETSHSDKVDSSDPVEDPFLSLKEAFSTGQEAFKLFYFEENQHEKFEVGHYDYRSFVQQITSKLYRTFTTPALCRM